MSYTQSKTVSENPQELCIGTYLSNNCAVGPGLEVL